MNRSFNRASASRDARQDKISRTEAGAPDNSPRGPTAPAGTAFHQLQDVAQGTPESGLPQAAAGAAAAVRDFDSTSLSPSEQRQAFEAYSGGLYKFWIDPDPGSNYFQVRHRDIAMFDWYLSLTEGFTSCDLVKDASPKQVPEEFSIGYRLSGANTIASEEGQNLWGPGSLLLINSARSIRSTAVDAVGAHVRFRLPRELAHDLAGDAAGVHNVLREDILAKLLGEHLKTLALNLAQADHVHARDLIGVTNTLITAALAPSRESFARAAEPIDAGLYRTAGRYIDSQLFHADLTPDSIAAAVGISRRKLYQVFEVHGGVARAIQARRLDRAHEMLADQATYTRIKQVAYALKFQSAAHFSRAFKQRFGYRPSDAAGVHASPR